MTEQQQISNWYDLTAQDVDLYRRFWMLCQRDNLKEFSSDTFRDYGLANGLSDMQHDIGRVFAKWKWHGLIIEVDWKRSARESNHARRIGVYKFKEPQ